jgi:acyl carrier protein
VPTGGVTPGPAWLRDLLDEVCGADPGPLRGHERLDEHLGLSAFERLQLVTSIEHRYGIEFPADLITAMETVEDVTHYTAVKLAQKPAPRRPDASV